MVPLVDQRIITSSKTMSEPEIKIIDRDDGATCETGVDEGGKNKKREWFAP